MKLFLRLLDGFSLSDPLGREIPIGSKKARILIAMLATSNRKLSRERLRSLLWGELDDLAAQGNLRQALSQLRRDLGEYASILRADGQKLELDSSRLACDVTEIRQAAATNDIDRLQHAADLIRGEFLAGYTLSDEFFADWLQLECASCAGDCASVLRKLVALAEFALRADYAKKLVALDPYDEGSQLLLLDTLVRSGNRAAAAKQYQSFCAKLRQDLDVTPSPATVQAAKAVMNSADVLVSPKQFQRERIEPRRRALLPSIAVVPTLGPALLPKEEMAALSFSELLASAISDGKQLTSVSPLAVPHSAPGFSPIDFHLKLGLDWIVTCRVSTQPECIDARVTLISTRHLVEVWSRQIRFAGDVAELSSMPEFAHLSQQIASEIERIEALRALQLEPAKSTAYEYYVRGKWMYEHGEDVFGSIQFLTDAVNEDRNFAPALAFLATAIGQSRFDGADVSAEVVVKITQCAARAVDLAPDDPRVLSYASGAFLVNGDWALAEQTAARAISLAPYDADVRHRYAKSLAYGGQHGIALPHMFLSKRLKPYSMSDYRYEGLVDTLFISRQYEAFLETCESWVDMPNYMMSDIASAQLLTNREKEANESIAMINLSEVDLFSACRWHARMLKNPIERAALLDAYRIAGIHVPQLQEL